MARVVGADSLRTPTNRSGSARLGAAPRPTVPDSPGPEQPGTGRRVMVPPRWVPITATVICALAVLDAAYLVYVEYTSTANLFCSTKGYVDCQAVISSSYGHPFGVPVAVPGLAWAVSMLVLCSPWAWRAVSPWVGRARLAGSVAGVAMVFYLLWAELIRLRHLCEYCTVMHILTVALFMVIVFGTALAVPADEGGLDVAS